MGKVLITGGTGFIGNHVTRMALESGDDVRVMVMPGEDRSPLDGMDVEFIEGNLLDHSTFAPALELCRFGPKTGRLSPDRAIAMFERRLGLLEDFESGTATT